MLLAMCTVRGLHRQHQKAAGNGGLEVRLCLCGIQQACYNIDLCSSKYVIYINTMFIVYQSKIVFSFKGLMRR